MKLEIGIIKIMKVLDKH